MRSFALFLAFLAVASAALSGSSAIPSCTRYALTSPSNLQIPESDYVANTLVYSAVDLMEGTPEGPFFNIRAGDCYWVPNGAFNCAFDLYLEAARTTLLGYGTLNSTNFQLNTTATASGFEYAGGAIQLTTYITATSFVAPTPSVNFQSLSTSVYFPLERLLPMDASSSISTYGNGISTVGANLYLTIWGSNGWNGSTWGSSRTTGFDLRALLTCSPGGSTGHNTGACPACIDGGRVVPDACRTQGRSISQTVSGNCLSLSFSSSTSTSSDNGCTSGSL